MITRAFGFRGAPPSVALKVARGRPPGPLEQLPGRSDDGRAPLVVGHGASLLDSLDQHFA